MDATFTCFSSHNEVLSLFHFFNDLHPFLTFSMDEERVNKLQFLDVLVECCSFAFITCIYRKPTFLGLYLSWILLLLSPIWFTRSSVSHSGLLRFAQITRLKANLNRLKIYFWVMGILRNSLLTPLTKLFLSLGIASGYLALLNDQFMLDFLGLDLLASWLLIRFLPLLYTVIIQLWFESSLQLELHFGLFIRMCSLSSNKAI